MVCVFRGTGRMGMLVFLVLGGGLWFCPGADANPWSLLITEFMADTSHPEGDLEWVELYNPTSLPVDLTGWSLGDEGTRVGWIEEGDPSELENIDMDELANDTSNHIYELSVYEAILKEALQDEAIEREEKDLLMELTKIMNVSEEERSKIYDHIRSKL